MTRKTDIVFCIIRILLPIDVYYNAKQKHPGCKKSARPIRSSIANRYVRPKTLISVEAKKLLIKNLFNYFKPSGISLLHEEATSPLLVTLDLYFSSGTFILAMQAGGHNQYVFQSPIGSICNQWNEL